MKITINPKYEYLRQFAETIADRFDNEGEVIHHQRNVIKVFQEEGLQINVKSYKIPIFINRVIYSFIREGKAKRAYNYALDLINKGIDTPEPIAYIEIYESGLISRSFFISVQSPLKHQMRIFANHDTEEYVDQRIDLIEGFARYTAFLHKLGIYHKDYSPGNILLDKVDGQLKFSLIDINRMKFDVDIDHDKGCANFARIRGNSKMIQILARTYANERGFDEQECLSKISLAKASDENSRDSRRKRKELFRRLKSKF